MGLSKWFVKDDIVVPKKGYPPASVNIDNHGESYNGASYWLLGYL
jgi:hypothetical protein